MHSSRNLTISQTLDEILGLDDSSKPRARNAVNSPIRPPTRHGRESSSGEEAIDDSAKPRKDDEDDDFLKKLNEIRRRSLIQCVDKEPSKETNRLPIHVEVDEVPLESTRTFRVDEESKPLSAHQKWLRRKLEAEKAAKAKKKAEEEEKARVEKERRENSAKLFERWKADADAKAREARLKQLKAQKEKRQQEEEEKARKRQEAQKTFEMWKSERSRSLVELRSKKLAEKQDKAAQIEISKQEKLKEADKAFNSWLENKKKRMQSNNSGASRGNDEDLKEYRALMAREAYETWLEMKDQQRDMMANLVLVQPPPAPWIPASNVVPRRFVRSSHSRRSKSLNRSKSRPRTSQITHRR